MSTDHLHLSTYIFTKSYRWCFLRNHSFSTCVGICYSIWLWQVIFVVNEKAENEHQLHHGYREMLFECLPKGQWWDLHNTNLDVSSRASSTWGSGSGNVSLPCLIRCPINSFSDSSTTLSPQSWSGVWTAHDGTIVQLKRMVPEFQRLCMRAEAAAPVKGMWWWSHTQSYAPL